MEAERGADGRRGLVPDQFRVHLHPSDLGALVPADELASELASGALSFAREHGYALRERPRVTLLPDPELRPGEVEVETFVSPAAESVALESAADAGTRVFEVPVVRTPQAVIQVQEPGRPARRVPLTGAPLRIGRAPECELTVRDSRASRRHARLVARNGVLVLTDLGSTNGTRVNGHGISEVVLGAGDRIVIGETSLVVEAAATSADAAEAGARP
jgi:hypothetical protein